MDRSVLEQPEDSEQPEELKGYYPLNDIVLKASFDHIYINDGTPSECIHSMRK